MSRNKIVIYFIPRKFLNQESFEIVNFENITALHNKSIITIVLGEPASGKTSQLEEYKKQNTHTTHFVELINIEDEEDISDDIDIVLLDSIDEALTDYINPKKIQSKLTAYIRECRTKNPKVRFIISCRYLEWSEYFKEELEKIDKKLQVYTIETLSTEDINTLLKQHSINEEDFWKFVKNNYLEPLFDNIMIILHIMRNFDEYNQKKISYIDIYKEIVKEHLTIKGKDREEISPTKPISELLLITSSLALYMSLNRIDEVSDTNLAKIADALYHTDKDIVADDLETILKTTLFKKRGSKIRFYHKSLQEFLAAYFIAYKKLDFKTIKKIFAHKFSFYEEFEEIIIYLTNIESGYFKYIVDFDPTIFRRHPTLSVSQQEMLFSSMLKILKNERYKVWGKYKYIKNSTLLKFDKVKNIPKMVKNQILTNEVNYEIYAYLVGLLNYNYSQELEDFIFDILESIKDDNKKYSSYVWHNYFTHIETSKRLFRFIRKNEFDYSTVSYYNYAVEDLFKSLYPYVDFNELFYFFDIGMSIDKNLLETLTIKDLLELTKHIQQQVEKYSDEQMSMIIFGFLQRYTELDFDKPMVFIVDLIEKNHHVFRPYSLNERELYPLDFDDVKDDLTACFFQKDKVDYNIKLIFRAYTIKLYDIINMAKSYPVENYPEHYQIFHETDDVANYLMTNNVYKRRRDDLLKSQEDTWTQIEKENLEKYSYLKEQKEKEEEEKQIYFDAINALASDNATDDIIWDIFRYASSISGSTKEKLQNDLKEKYSIFIELVKEMFYKDELYKNYENDLLDGKYYYISNLYVFLFSSMDDEEIVNFIADEEKYKKIFWHIWSIRKIDLDKFTLISKKYKSSCAFLSNIVLERSFDKEEYTNIDTLKYILIDIELFDKSIFSKLITKLKDEYSQKFKTLKSIRKSYYLDYISLDNDYDYFKNIMLKDKKEDENIYLEYLLRIDINRVFDEFKHYFFPEQISFKKMEVINRLSPVYKYGYFDNTSINPIKQKALKKLFALLYKERIAVYKLTDDNLYILLSKYYSYFNEYHHPLGSYSPGFYDNTHDIVNNLWNIFKEDKEKITLFTRLSNSSNERLSAIAKSYIKDLFDKYPDMDIDYKSILDTYKEDDNRFFNYDKLTNNLMEISLILTASRHSIFRENEDLINDRYRDALKLKSYTIADQSRGGESESGKSVGERDLVVIDKETGISETVLEGFIFNTKTKAINHYDKLIKKYDTVGNNQNYMLVYVRERDFKDACKKYQSWFDDTQIEETEKNNICLIKTKYNDMNIIHILINFYSH